MPGEILRKQLGLECLPQRAPKTIRFRRYENLASVPHGAWEDMCYDSFYKGDYKMLKEKTTKELEDLKQARDQSVSRIAWYSKHLCDEQENIEKCERILQLCESKLIN